MLRAKPIVFATRRHIFGLINKHRGNIDNIENENSDKHNNEGLIFKILISNFFYNSALISMKHGTYNDLELTIMRVGKPNRKVWGRIQAGLLRFLILETWRDSREETQFLSPTQE